MSLSDWIFWKNKIWRSPKAMFTILILTFIGSIILYIHNPEEAMTIDPSDRRDYRNHPFYVILFLLTAVMGYIMASSGRSGDAFKSKYT